MLQSLHREIRRKQRDFFDLLLEKIPVENAKMIVIVSRYFLATLGYVMGGASIPPTAERWANAEATAALARARKRGATRKAGQLARSLRLYNTVMFIVPFLVQQVVTPHSHMLGCQLCF